MCANYENRQMPEPEIRGGETDEDFIEDTSEVWKKLNDLGITKPSIPPMRPLRADALDDNPEKNGDDE